MGILNKIGAKKIGIKIDSNIPEKEKRKLEVEKLKPDRLPPYIGESPSIEAKRPIEKQTIRLVFKNMNDHELFCRYFKVANYVEKSVNNLELLTDFLKAIESGDIIYENGKFTIGNNARKQRMDRKKSR